MIRKGKFTKFRRENGVLMGKYCEFAPVSYTHLLNLLSEIREDILWDMKVVFYTSYDKYLLQALRESAFDFLLKPFEAEDGIRDNER